MNERFQQLAEQAGIYLIRVIPDSAKPDIHCSDEAMEKFANLVIQDYENTRNRTVTQLL